MNCDHVFDILTRGPFPAGEPTDTPVERHLLACHDCRQLAEALRPAVALFHECIGADELARLPGYRGRLNDLAADNPARIQVGGGNYDDQNRTAGAFVSPAPPKATPVTPRRNWPRRNWPRCNWPHRSSAGILAGLLLTILLVWQWNVAQQPPPAADELSWSSGPLRPTPDERGQLLLASLGLPGDCLDANRLAEPLRAEHPGTKRRLAERELADGTTLPLVATYLCCTHCHAAGSRPSTTFRTVAAIVRSCEACHTTDERSAMSGTLEFRL